MEIIHSVNGESWEESLKQIDEQKRKKIKRKKNQQPQ